MYYIQINDSTTHLNAPRTSRLTGEIKTYDDRKQAQELCQYLNLLKHFSSIHYKVRILTPETNWTGTMDDIFKSYSTP